MVLQIPNAEDFLSPRFELKINDFPLNDEFYPFVNSVSWEQEEGLIDLITLSVDNTGFQFSDTNVFNFGNELELLGGYKNNLTSLGKGVIERWVPSFPESGNVNLVIKAFSPARILMEEFGNETKKWRKAIDSEVVESIAKIRELNFVLDIEPTTKQRRRTKYRKKNEKDWDLIKRLADNNDYDFWIEWDSDLETHVFHFHPFRESKKSEFTLKYDANEQTNLNSVELDVVLPGQSNKVEIIGWDQELGQTIQVIVEPKKASRRTEDKFAGILKEVDFQLRLGQDVILDSTKRSPIKVITTKKFQSEADAIKFAENIFRQEERAFTEAVFKMPGLPGLKTRQVFQVEGLGKRFSAKYWVKQSSHAFTGGDDGTYMTTWQGKIIAEV